MPAEKCVFCDITAGQARAHIIDENPLAVAILDINPFAEGHCLILSKRHVVWWQELTDEEIVSVFSLAKRVANRLGSAFSPEFVCLYARGRRIPHTHIFLVPTKSGDVLDSFFNALERVQESSNALAELKTAEALESAAKKIRMTD
ncbi:MAG: HIT family protein [Thermoanaerobaculia bacterium]